MRQWLARSGLLLPTVTACSYMYTMIVSLVCCFIVHCKGFSFHCNNNKCISEFMKCNGKDDCGDNSDENTADCLTGKLIAAECASIKVLCY